MKTVGVSTISKKGERQRYLPLEIRMQMYDDVIELRKQGLTYKEIQRELYEKYGKQVSIKNIYRWIHRKHHPLGRVHEFNKKPSLELAYIIGAMRSDGYKHFDGRNSRLGLAVKDKEFAEEFGKCSAKVLEKNKPYKPYWDKNRKVWVVEVCSILLYEFLDKPLEELKPYIEYSKKTVSAFLKALFNGDGSMHKSRRILMLHNTNEELLNYAKHLLKKYFNSHTTGPNLATKSGKVKHFPNRKTTKTKKDQYYLYIRIDSLLNFYKYIGFTIERKQKKTNQSN